jgi:chemotaxis protein methyltransferase CheR
MLRNVLIYFDVETKVAVLSRARQCLSDEGWLLLGGAETPTGAEGLFERVRLGGATVYRARRPSEKAT